MANQDGGVPEEVIGIPADPSSNDTVKLSDDGAECCKACCGAFTTLMVFLLLVIPCVNNITRCHTKFSIESISLSSSSSSPQSSSIWIVDFLVKNPNSRYPLYYEGDYVSAKVGPLYGAVLNISENRHEGFLIAFATEEAKDLVSDNNDLNIVLRGRHKLFVDVDEAGQFDVLCRNLTAILLPDLKTKIECHSSFKRLKPIFH